MHAVNQVDGLSAEKHGSKNQRDEIQKRCFPTLVAVVSVQTVWKTYSTSMWQWPVALVHLSAKNASPHMCFVTPRQWNYCTRASTEQ